MDDSQKKKTDKNAMTSAESLFSRYQLEDKGGRITREFQDYGYRLAKELEDESHKSLYIKLAKTVDRHILEKARTFVLDAKAQSRARLFMWKLKELRQQQYSESKVTKQLRLDQKEDSRSR